MAMIFTSCLHHKDAMFFKSRKSRNSDNSPLSTGRFGEDLALQYLKETGCVLVERNFRLRSGEIDIIVKDGDTLVFVEVKARTNKRYGSPFDAIDHRKQRQISQTALAFISKQRYEGWAVRFDVIAVYLDEQVPRVELLKNAFEYCGP